MIWNLIFATRWQPRRLTLLSVLALCSFGQSQTLTHGPIAGGVTASSARFYLRVEPAAVANIEVSTFSDFSSSLLSPSTVTEVDRDFASVVEVHDLQTNQRYYYRALVNGQIAGETRQFRTFPASGERTPIRFVFGSCIRNRNNVAQGDGRIFEVMAREEPLFFLHLGDWLYPDSTASASNPTDVFSAKLERVRATYRARFDSLQPVQNLLRVTAVDYIYDDNDYLNNDASATSYPDIAAMKTVFVSDSARRNSILAYQQSFPGYPLANTAGGIWHKFSSGNLDVFMLDTRSQRSPNLEAFVFNAQTDSFEFKPDARHSILAGDSTLVGEHQMSWLLRELQASTADWKFIVTSVPFNIGMNPLIDLAVGLQDSAITIPGSGTITYLQIGVQIADKWCGFPHDQQRVLDFIKTNNIKNVIVLSGDTHTAAIDDGANAGLPELMAGALEQANSRIAVLLQLVGFDVWNGGGQVLGTNNYNDAYGRVTVWGADSVDLEIVDEFGEMIAKTTILSQSASSEVQSTSGAKPERFQLVPGYPNPFSPQQHPLGTTIRYALPQRAFVTATVYDLLGRRVLAFQPVFREVGHHELRWDGRNAAGDYVVNGIYLIRFLINDFSGSTRAASQKVALLR